MKIILTILLIVSTTLLSFSKTDPVYNKTIYIAGDTEYIPEMKELKDIDIAFLPMNLPYTMSPQMVVKVVQAFTPDILYPYHTEQKYVNELQTLLKETDIQLFVDHLD
jgi:L-ascorbate metabolism protein UlaG (beta-lactamase superfamily)